MALPSRRHGPARGESLPLAAVLVLLAMSAVALVLAATATTGAARSRVDPYRRRGPVP